MDMRYGISDMPATENLEEEEEEEEEERKKKRNKEAMAGSIRRQQYDNGRPSMPKRLTSFCACLEESLFF